MKYFVTVIATVMVIVGAYFAYNMGIAPLIPSTTVPGPAKAVAVPPKAVETPAPEKKYELYTVGNWSGRGRKNTETFHISSDVWMITWASSPDYKSQTAGVLAVHLFRGDGTLIDTVTMVTGKNQDQSIMRGAGDYYLKIESAGVGYSVTASALREVP